MSVTADPSAPAAFPGTGKRERSASSRFLSGLFFLYMLPLFGLILTHADMYLYKRGIWPVRPVVSLFALLAPPLGWLLLVEARTRWRRPLSLLLVQAPLILPLAGLAVLSCLGAMRPGAYWGEGAKIALYPLYTLVVTLCAMLLPLLPAYRRHFEKLVWVSLLVLLTTVVADVFVPGLFAKHGSRAAGFAEGPNTTAFLLVLCACVLVGPRRSRLGNGAVLLLTGLGVLLTLSRGGFLIYILLLVSMMLYSLADPTIQKRKQLLAAVLGLGALLLGGALTSYLASQEVGMFSRHGARDRAGRIVSGALVDTSDYRVELIGTYLDEIAEAPLLGFGSGYALGLPKGPHNRYLYEWVNLGLPGFLLLVIWVLGGLWLFLKRRHPQGFFVVVQVAAWCVFSHTLLEDRSVLLLLGSLATLSLPAFWDGAHKTPAGRGEREAA